ncbi:hypothetical protein, partial [Streptomyces sp. NPDC003832]
GAVVLEAADDCLVGELRGAARRPDDLARGLVANPTPWTRTGTRPRSAKGQESASSPYPRDNSRTT